MKIEHVLFPSVFSKITDPFDGRSFVMCSHDQFFGTNKNRILKNGSCERALRTFQSITTEHTICADKLVLAANVFYSFATVCYVLTKSYNFWKHRILIVIRICALIAR